MFGSILTLSVIVCTNGRIQMSIGTIAIDQGHPYGLHHRSTDARGLYAHARCACTQTRGRSTTDRMKTVIPHAACPVR